VNPHTLARSLALVLPLTAVTGCALFSTPSVGLVRVDDLVDWVEQVYVDCELSREEVERTIDSLQSLVSPDFQGDAVVAFASFQEAIERSRTQGDKMRASVAAMREAAEPVFEQWSADLLEFSNATMRQRSQIRLASTRERYAAILAAARPAQDAHDRFNVAVRDVALFLGHDFNAGSVVDVADDVSSLSELAAELDGRFAECLQAARAYIDASALPVRVEIQDTETATSDTN
jgi:hypothetical protein